MNKIFEIKFGSHLYGTSTPESDMDFKGIYIPNARQIILNDYPRTMVTSRPKGVNERNTKDDVDIDTYSLDRFLELLTEGQTVALDMLFSNPSDVSEITDQGVLVMQAIWENRTKLLTRNVNAFVGYAKKQASRYGIKGSRMDALKRTVALLETLPGNDKLAQHSDKIEALVKECESMVSLEQTALIEVVSVESSTGLLHLHVNGRKSPFTATVRHALTIYRNVLSEYGSRAIKAHLEGNKDFKALSHAVRVNYEAIELLTTGKITFPRPEKELLRKIKKAEIPYDEVATLIEQGLADLHQAHLTSTLRDVPDQEWVDNFIYSIYSEVVKNG